MPPQQHAFTAKSAGILREIHTEIGIRPASVGLPTNGAAVQDTSGVLQTIALWDTGATNCAVTSSTVEALGLVPISQTEVHHAAGTSIENVYLIDIFLPNRLVIPGVSVTGCADGGFGVIIGMDVITMGDFCITNVGGATTVSFRIPSQKEIDFVTAATAPVQNGRPRGPAFTPPKSKKRR